MKQKRHEIFSYLFELSKDSPNLLSSYLKGINNIGIKYSLFLYLPYKLLYKYIGKDIDYVFLDTKYIDLVKSLSPHKSIVLTSLRNVNLVKEQKNVFVFPVNYILYGVAKLFRTDPLLEKKQSKKIIDFTVNFFKKTRPKFLIVSNDSLFIERFLIYCAREAGVKTICIQDGIFQEKSFHGKYADFMYVWSKQQQHTLIRGGLPPHKLSILGYPYERLTSKHYAKDYDRTKICILGQPWENFDRKLGKKKKQIFDKVISQFAEVDVVYKPHPAEKDIKYFPDNVTLFRGSLLESIEEYDYFFSLTSTALLEVSLNGKIAIQLYDTDFNCDKFEEIGWSYTYDMMKDINITKYLDGIDESFSVGEDSIFIPKDIGQRFLDLEKIIQY